MEGCKYFEGQSFIKKFCRNEFRHYLIVVWRLVNFLCLLMEDIIGWHTVLSDQYIFYFTSGVIFLEAGRTSTVVSFNFHYHIRKLPNFCMWFFVSVGICFVALIPTMLLRKGNSLPLSRRRRRLITPRLSWSQVLIFLDPWMRFSSRLMTDMNRWTSLLSTIVLYQL